MARVRLLLAKHPGEDEKAFVIAAEDETLWEHGEAESWSSLKREWPDEYEWREVWALFDQSDLDAAFESVDVLGKVAS